MLKGEGLVSALKLTGSARVSVGRFPIGEEFTFEVDEATGEVTVDNVGELTCRAKGKTFNTELSIFSIGGLQILNGTEKVKVKGNGLTIGTHEVTNSRELSRAGVRPFNQVIRELDGKAGKTPNIAGFKFKVIGRVPAINRYSVDSGEARLRYSPDSYQGISDFEIATDGLDFEVAADRTIYRNANKVLLSTPLKAGVVGQADRMTMVPVCTITNLP